MASEKTWTLHLNRYQRDNLLWLINMLGWSSTGVEPFNCANTGDWVGEIGWMLQDPEDKSLTCDRKPSESGLPNLSSEELRRRVEVWARRRKEPE